MTMHRKFHQLLVVFSLCFSACNNTADTKKSGQKIDVAADTLRINIEDEPESLDPRKVRSLNSNTLLKMLFEGLTRINQAERAELAQAESILISEDQKTYTIALRKNDWSNRDPVTAYDFEYAWKKVLDPSFPADNAYQLFVIKNAKAAKKGECPLEDVGVKALDENTLEIVLENPTAYFLDLLAMPVFFPIPSKVEQKNPEWAYQVQNYVCNGPFTLEKWKPHDVLQLKKNSAYWDAASVQLKHIVMTMVTADTAMKMFEKHELDWAGSPLSTLPADALSQLKKDGALKTKPLLGTYFFRTNTKKFPLDSAVCRKALALALNRKTIIEHVLHGKQIAATGLVPACMDLQSSPYFDDGNQTEARQLFDQFLKEQKLTVDNFPKVSLTYANSERNRVIAQAVQQQWLEVLGIRVDLEAIESKVYYDRVGKQDFQMAAGSWTADFNDPINFLEVFKYKSASTNNTCWENLEYTELLDRCSCCADTSKRRNLLARSEQLLMEEMPIIPIFHYNMLYLANDAVQDVVLTSLGTMDFKWAKLQTK